MKRIGVLTSGGDAPGMNAAIRAVVRTASYYDCEVIGIQQGYDGLINGQLRELQKSDVANIIHRGGTVLRTARSLAFREPEGRAKAFKVLNDNHVEGLVVIGGNGTYTGAMHMANEHDIAIVGLPGTIDNDIYGTDRTIGFDTAINTAIDAVDKIRDTADSHSRLFFIEVMGRHSGYIALHTGIGSGASSVFMPEKARSITSFIESIRQSGRRSKLFNLVIVAEGNKFGGAQEIAALIKNEYQSLDVRTAIIGHLQRGGSPTAADRVLASRLAYYGVKSLLEKQRNVALGWVNNEIKLTSFKEAISLKKEPSNSMIEMAEILAL